MVENNGLVYLIGMGPGDPELATLKAIRALMECDVFVYDKLVNPCFLEMNPKAELMFVGKVSRNHTKTQDEINELLLRLAKAGKKVGRLKGGDPFVFGRGGEEAAFLKEHGVKSIVISGITSAVSVPTSVGIPITHRGLATSFHVITGHERDGISRLDWEAYGKVNGTLCFLMGMEKLGEITKNLLDAGKAPDCGAAVIMKGTTGYQRQVFGNLSDIEEKVRVERITSPAIILIGDVVNMREKIRMEEELPLQGVRLGITRPVTFGDPLVEGLKELGALLTYVPSIRKRPRAEFREELAAVDFQKVKAYAFASKEGVEQFFKGLRELHIDVRGLAGTFFAIGNTTRDALGEKGIFHAVVTGEGSSVSMVEKINASADVEPSEILLITGDRTCGSWHEKIKGWETERLIAYTTETGYLHGLDEPVDGLLFLSSSSVRGFFKGGEGTPHSLSELEIKKIPAICSGFSSKQAAMEVGFQKVLSSDRPEAAKVIETVLDWWSKAGKGIDEYEISRV